MWEGTHTKMVLRQSSCLASILLCIKFTRECLALWSVVFVFPSYIKGVCDYYAAVVFQMGECLEDSGELGIECPLL